MEMTQDIIIKCKAIKGMSLEDFLQLDCVKRRSSGIRWIAPGIGKLETNYPPITSLYDFCKLLAGDGESFFALMTWNVDHTLITSEGFKYASLIHVTRNQLLEAIEALIFQQKVNPNVISFKSGNEASD